MFDSAATVKELSGLAADGLDCDGLLAGIAAVQTLINAANAAQLAMVAEFAHRRPAPEVPTVPGGERSRGDGVSEFAAAELAGVLRLTRRGGDMLLDTALSLERLPATMGAFRTGSLDLRRAYRILDACHDLPDDCAAALEAAVLPRAAEQTVPELTRTARRAALRLCPRTADERHQATARDRSVWVEHFGDGRSRFIAEGPTHDILRIFAAVDAVARARTTAGDGGHAGAGGADQGGDTLEQRRFDALTAIADTLLDDPDLPGTRHGAPGIVMLADLATLTRLADTGDHSDRDTAAGRRPVELLGDGPLSDALAVELLGDPHAVLLIAGRCTPWVCDHTAGYQVPDRLARHLTARHPRCVFPGCGIPTYRCDLDHVTPWPTGPTCACNLRPLCRYHHRLKTHTSWQLTIHPDDGRARWTSPTGRIYHVHPDDGAQPETPHQAAA